MRVYGLIGKPLVHSFSAEFFNRKFQREGIDACYRNFELPNIGDLMKMLAEQPELCGFNVTIPYKEAVIPYLSSISPMAREIGAVNVVRIIRHGNDLALEGHNSDAPAFARSVASMISDAGKPLRALVLGTGGASKAVCHALRMHAIEPQLVSRTPAPEVLTYADLDREIMTSHTVIVNTTPLGTYPHTDTRPDIPYHLITPDHVCMDLTYNPPETLFMQLCAKYGAKVKNGFDMLTLQALLSWEIWNKT